MHEQWQADSLGLICWLISSWPVGGDTIEQEADARTVTDTQTVTDTRAVTDNQRADGGQSARQPGQGRTGQDRTGQDRTGQRK